MAKDDLYAFQGVILKCDKGATVLPLLTTPKKHAVSKLQIATVTDNVPIVNIPSFGVCSITGSACMPMAPEWLKAHDGAQKVLGQAPLLFSSYCKCQAGGTIEIFPSVEAAKAELEKDKESRVDGIPWLDGALGAALTSPIGPILDMFTDGDHDVTEGVGRGFRKGLKGTWNGLVQMVSHPVETATGLTEMVGIAVVGYGGPIPTGPLYTPEQRLKDFDATFGTKLAQKHAAIGDAIADGWDKKVVNGTTEERSEVVGQVYEAVFEAAVGTKGAGAAVKGITTAGKFVIGADRLAEITAAIAKLRSAMKLEELATKVKGIFKVGSKEIKLKLDYEDLGKKAPCFLAGTPVQTYNGLTPIENIKIGDIVFCYDFEQNKSVKNEVINIYNNWTNRYIKITTDDGIIETTFKHLFWIVEEKKWVTAKELKVDMILKSLTSKQKVIRRIDYFNNVELFTFNIEVENVHNYFVGDYGVLVHNDNKPSKFEGTTRKPIKIYEVYDTRTGETKYVGQTDKPDVRDRFDEHLNSPNTRKIDKAEWKKHYDIRKVQQGNWDPYEAAVWEQHYIEKNGGKAGLENGRDEISKEKFDKYQNLHDPC